MRTKIVLVDDHAIVRQGLKALIEKRPGMQVVGEAGNGRDAVRLSSRLNPDVIIMDISMPDLNGIDAAQQISAVSTDTKVIALSMHSDKRFVLGMLKAGAAGFLLKESAFGELMTAIDAALAGQIYLSPKITGRVLNNYLQSMADSDISAASVLTTGERQVLQLIAEGRTTRDMAACLNISVKTVEARRKKIMEKLNLNNLAALIKFALREGLSSIDS
jgi:DNA-binding NarL/FixJ family response regulator